LQKKREITIFSFLFGGFLGGGRGEKAGTWEANVVASGGERHDPCRGREPLLCKGAYRQEQKGPIQREKEDWLRLRRRPLRRKSFGARENF